MSFADLTSAIYAVVSAPPEARNWESIRALYHPRATMVRTGIDSTGERFALVMSFDEYIANASELLKGVSFHEVELHQEVREFGNVAQLTSVYEFDFKNADKEFSGRGINFFNLINGGDGWKIISIVWDNERDGLSLPDWS
ncbi:MAG TPA: nuclear transport factor 2 family protein [Woeseiaceae bacterium]|nr:nuclear transport factor 2 family protein [Woeseiaceae bacterium]